MNNKKSIFETLFEINVNKRIEKKNGLSYLSWPYAWAEVKKLYPNATYTVYETESGCIYFTDGKTCWVKTGVTIDDLEHIEYLPVMDYRNRSILLENVTSFDVNKSIQRSLTKALARHGLGLYIYAGEDLPEIETERITQKDAVILKNMVNKMESEGAVYNMVLKRYEVKNFKELSLKQYQDILSGLNEMISRGKNKEIKEIKTNENN